jgi:rhodanese-related sulfurtransferase
VARSFGLDYFAGRSKVPAKETLMKTLIVLVSLAALAACSKGEGASNESESASAGENADRIPEVSVNELAAWIEDGSAIPVDANSDSTRAENGVIPGARLLTSSGRYDPGAELPTDQAANLVFYCGNTDCRASDGAAERALEAGYSNVKILRAGIAGWVAAGQQVERPAS